MPILPPDPSHAFHSQGEGPGSTPWGQGYGKGISPGWGRNDNGVTTGGAEAGRVMNKTRQSAMACVGGPGAATSFAGCSLTGGASGSFPGGPARRLQRGWRLGFSFPISLPRSQVLPLHPSGRRSLGACPSAAPSRRGGGLRAGFAVAGGGGGHRGLHGGRGGVHFFTPVEQVGALCQGLAELRHTARGLSGDNEGTGTQRLRLATEQRDVLFLWHGRAC